MTPEEKQIDLDRYRKILLATLDYDIGRSAGSKFNQFVPSNYFQQLKVQVEDHYQKKRLSILKQWFRDLTEPMRETNDFYFSRYIKQKTGYDIDIFTAFAKRINRIVDRNKIRNEGEYREVESYVDHLCQQIPVDQVKIDQLNNLLLEFDRRAFNDHTK